MPHIDWDGFDPNEAPVSNVTKPGVYLAEVARAEERHGGWSLRLKDMESGRVLCFDLLTFSEKAVGIARKKMACLGMRGISDPEARDFEGRRVWIKTKLETYEGSERAKVDIYADGFYCGYLSEEEGNAKWKPGAVAKPVPAKVSDSETPF